MKGRLHRTFFYFLCFSAITADTVAFVPSHFDLTLVGQIKYADGLGRIPIGIASLFKNEFTFNHISIERHSQLLHDDFTDVPDDLAKMLRNSDKTPGNVGILTCPLWADLPQYMPQNCFIKIAYSMVECNAVPEQWVKVLNKQFDLVVVPDEYYRSVYLSSGVQIPIFVVPHGIYIEDFLNEPLKKRTSDTFVFGCSAAFRPRKNHALLIEAFHAEFGNNPAVKLRIHGKQEYEAYLRTIQDKVKNLNANNIELIIKPFSDKEFQSFFKSLDCYVLVSKGEGFSVTPREALSLGVPCVISNNTAHKTICNTGYVYSVPSTQEEPYVEFGSANCIYFNCSLNEVRQGLRAVYDNYDYYFEKAQQARVWVQRYLWKNLYAKFLNLVKPKKVLLGGENIITHNFIMTTSEPLYKKYIELQKSGATL